MEEKNYKDLLLGIKVIIYMQIAIIILIIYAINNYPEKLLDTYIYEERQIMQAQEDLENYKQIEIR